MEHHGSYSVERLHQLREYQSSTSLIRAWTVVILTPLPCLAAVTLLDSIPIAPPSAELAHSHLYWLQCFLICWFINTGILVQLRQMAPRLAVTLTQLAWMPVFISGVGIAITISMAWAIGFPLPFTIAFSTPGQCFAVGWGRLLWRNREARREVARSRGSTSCSLSRHRSSTSTWSSATHSATSRPEPRPR